MTAPSFDSARTDDRGLLDRELTLSAWTAMNSYGRDLWTAERLLELKTDSVAVVLPAREVADTIETVVGALVPLREAGLVDELAVVDAASRDGTAELAAARGATVLQESEVLEDHGPARGKGDAMWRALAATSSDIVVYLDTDTVDFDERFLLGMLGPLFERPEIAFVKGAFRRPFAVEGAAAVPDAGGRVTELAARPLLNLFFPELGGFAQPLAGETAGRRALLESLPYPVGYGVEIAMMIDVAREVGVDAMAQVDLGTRQNRHQSLRALSAMAYAVIAAVARRSPQGPGHAAAGALALPTPDGLELRHVPLEERPALRTIEARTRALASGPVISPTWR